MSLSSSPPKPYEHWAMSVPSFTFPVALQALGCELPLPVSHPLWPLCCGQTWAGARAQSWGTWDSIMGASRCFSQQKLLLRHPQTLGALWPPGTRCQQDVDECAGPSPCGAHGTCTNVPGSFRCTCDSGFHGPFCSLDSGSCEPSECPAGGGRPWLQPRLLKASGSRVQGVGPRGQ